MSFRTQLALVCLQVFVLLAASFGLLVSAQHKRAQGHRRDVPARFESATSGKPALQNSAETALATTETIRGQSPPASLSGIGESDIGESENADVRSEIAELRVADLEAISAAAKAATAAYNLEANNSAAQKPQAEPAGDPTPALAESAATAPFKNLVMSQPRKDAAGLERPANAAPRSTRRTTRIVNNVQQPAVSDSRHRTAVRKRRWEIAAERRAANRSESLPLPAGR